MPHSLTESEVELAALEWLQDVGYALAWGPDLAPDGIAPERSRYADVILTGRLHNALARLNPTLPPVALDDAYRQLTRTDSPNLFINNHRFHRLLVDGVDVSYQDKQGRTVYTKARVVDFDPASKLNDCLAVNQFSIRKEGVSPHASGLLENTRRPDILLFINGLPLAVIELKNPADENADTYAAFKQLQTYKHEIANLFTSNGVLAVSDGTDARLGSLTAGWEWFKPWRTIDGDTVERQRPPLETLIRGVFPPARLLDLLRYFTVFETHKGTVVKKIAGYHQYWAANKAVARTLQAVGEEGDGRVGVVWHTQGSGKSLSMLFYAGKVIQEPALANPTLVVLTDRNDLDDQLYNTFAAGSELLRQTPQQAESRLDLRDKLQVASGGVVFTTIQKFLPDAVGATQTHRLADAETSIPKGQGFPRIVGSGFASPLLSTRRNIVFIVDEAHRTQYGFQVRYVEKDGGVYQVYGLAKYMRDALPNAAFVGFTGTPVSQKDHNTYNVFGSLIDVYDIHRSVEDKATVRIYYDARHAKLKLDERMAPHIDSDFEEVTEREEVALKEQLKTRWAQMAAIVGNPERVTLVAQDIVTHFEQRDAVLPGKAMIVCMTRQIAVAMHDALVKLRPGWYHPDDDKGMLKVVMTGSAADGDVWQEHIRNTRRRQDLADRFRDEKTGFKVVIVRDMWLTGFDCPSLHTMYVDKPMQGHTLMQAIARVNRVYPGKEGGLVVAYLPLQTQLQEALRDYSEDDQEETGRLQDEAAEIMMEKYEVVKAMFHGFDYKAFFVLSGGGIPSPTARLTVLANAVNFILEGRERQRDRYIDAVTALGQAFALATPHEKAIAIREEVGFFQAVKAPLVKTLTVGITRSGKTPQELDAAVQSIVARAVAPEGVVDLFSLAGLAQEDISILSEEFLTEVRALPQHNVAVELLRRLINDAINARRRRNLIQSRSFAAMLQATLARYNQQNVAAAEIIEELIRLAEEMRTAGKRGEDLGLSEDELAFYDALEVNDSAVKVLGDAVLRQIAQELVKKVRENVSIDWELKESARAGMRTLVKRILRKYGYPPDKAESATATVVQQAELLSKQWASE